MRVLMIAPPGAGKGTQSALIAAHFGIPHIATGELLRDHVARRTSLGLAVREYLDRGELVPDQVVLDMVREAIVAATVSRARPPARASPSRQHGPRCRSRREPMLASRSGRTRHEPPQGRGTRAGWHHRGVRWLG
jgi:hypothetical protein